MTSRVPYNLGGLCGGIDSGGFGVEIDGLSGNLGGLLGFLFSLLVVIVGGLDGLLILRLSRLQLGLEGLLAVPFAGLLGILADLRRGDAGRVDGQIDVALHNLLGSVLTEHTGQNDATLGVLVGSENFTIGADGGVEHVTALDNLGFAGLQIDVCKGDVDAVADEFVRDGRQLLLVGQVLELLADQHIVRAIGLDELGAVGLAYQSDSFDAAGGIHVLGVLQEDGHFAGAAVVAGDDQLLIEAVVGVDLDVVGSELLSIGNSDLFHGDFLSGIIAYKCFVLFYGDFFMLDS